ncbi:MAG: hypothetical protein MPW14_23070 [Candidatus Manganitrophus sp.]|nr:hypothetical protein [Candidatus Manganitrophus sp.]WDT72579.1 MAG: hypothetical protein MPW17_07005 [Candidatus Manganitrophus sp.]WDT79964.1 MAG: hypothetical protein MPW14_23070 [Candidatus Manganitrophus sp.]
MVAAGSSNAVVIFSDGTFVVASPPDVEPADLIAALLAARPFLESHHGKAYETLDQYISSDKETQRMARLENIMGAIRNNLPQIPELKDELRRFLDDKER